MFKDNLKILRTQKGMSQEVLAQQLNVVRQTISKWEKGVSIPDAEMLVKIAECFEVPVSQLLGEEVEEKNIDEVAIQLAVLNDQLARRSGRTRKIVKTVLIIVLIIIALSIVVPIILGLSFGYRHDSNTETTVIESHEAVNYEDETQSVVGKTFIRTFNVKNVEKTDDEDILQVSISQFQVSKVITVELSRRLCPEIKAGNNYEFEFEIQDDAILGTYEDGKQMQDDFAALFTYCRVISVVKTDRIGSDQIQESI